MRKLLNLSGVLILSALILITAPFAVPRFFGYQVYGILTDSMYPAYRPGDLIYVKEVSADAIRPGDVIAYTAGTATEFVISHRVLRTDKENHSFITKGDSGKSEDMTPVVFSRLKGRVVCRIPLLGRLCGLFENTAGKIKLLLTTKQQIEVWHMTHTGKYARLFLFEISS